ncbi:hypothetical protein ACHAWF_011856 [Thalassiosira exigua]
MERPATMAPTGGGAPTPSISYSPLGWECPRCLRRRSGSDGGGELTFLRGTCRHDVCGVCIARTPAAASKGAGGDGSLMKIACPIDGCASGVFYVERKDVEGANDEGRGGRERAAMARDRPTIEREGDDRGVIDLCDSDDGSFGGEVESVQKARPAAASLIETEGERTPRTKSSQSEGANHVTPAPLSQPLVSAQDAVGSTDNEGGKLPSPSPPNMGNGGQSSNDPTDDDGEGRTSSSPQPQDMGSGGQSANDLSDKRGDSTETKDDRKDPHRSEVGYILLEECQVLVPTNLPRRHGDAATSSSVTSPKDREAAPPLWSNVDLQGEGGLPKSNLDKNDGCDLVLHPTNGNLSSWRSATKVDPFNGLLSEIVVAGATNNNSSVLADKQRRSDASLLAGLAIEINRQEDDYSQQKTAGIHMRHLRVHQVQVMFWENAACNKQDELDDDASIICLDDDVNEKYSSGQLRRAKASMLLTFSLPIHEPNSSPSLEDKDCAPKKKSKARAKAKMLSSGHQLVGSIIRCDWSHLDATMKRLEQKALASRSRRNVEEAERQSNPPGDASPFFPDKLIVQELYDRISGASQHLGQSQTTTDPVRIVSEDTLSSTPVTFLDLPEEITATSIASYLRAKSLHALRATNRKTYKSLRAVVPGLKLKLFHHQTRSLEWMEMRERRCIAEDDLIAYRRSLKSRSSFSSEYFLNKGEAVCGGDYHRAVTGGATVLLCPRVARRVFRFNSESGCLIPLKWGVERKTRCARGGLLCDDPGLGKTITIISLILRSFGLSTEATADSKQTDDDALFYSYWYSSFITEHVRKPALLKLITRLIKSDRESGWFVPPIDEFLADCPDYLGIIPDPISLQEIRYKYSKSDCKALREFERDVRLCFSNAMTYNPEGHHVHNAAKRLSNNFEEILVEFKKEQLRIASRSLSRMKNDEGAKSLVDAFEAKKRAELEEPLVPSKSTLLVVPVPLLTHWEEQILKHIDFSYILNDQSHCPQIYYHTSRRSARIPRPNVCFHLKDITDPLIFIDDGSRPLPPPSVLARFPIYLTSYHRFATDFKHGSIEQELRASKGHRGGTYWGEDTPIASNLLKVHWLRVIVDEGHVMGKNNSTNMIKFSSWLYAERHWAMTGTPTQQVNSQSGLRNLYHLTNFLRHDFFSQRLGREKVWNSLIDQGWRAGCLSSFFRLKHIVSYLMVRHTKADFVEIPPPLFSTKSICLSRSESKTYNTIISSIRTNIITTSMEGRTSGWQDSLLNPRQSRHALEALTNCRIACCGGLQIVRRVLA